MSAVRSRRSQLRIAFHRWTGQCSRYQMCALHQLVLSGEQRATDASLQKVAINYLRSPSMRCLPALQKRYICHTITLNIVIVIIILKELWTFGWVQSCRRWDIISNCGRARKLNEMATLIGTGMVMVTIMMIMRRSSPFSNYLLSFLSWPIRIGSRFVGPLFHQVTE